MTRAEALKLRKIIEQATQSLPEETALQAVILHPAWKIDAEYTAGYKVQRNDKLWRCIQGHTAQEGWEPENAVSLWEQINETHVGTLQDPIPYYGNMTLVNGLYYVQDYVVYLCIRDTINPVYNALNELIGTYVETA